MMGQLGGPMAQSLPNSTENALHPEMQEGLSVFQGAQEMQGGLGAGQFGIGMSDISLVDYYQYANGYYSKSSHEQHEHAHGQHVP